MIDFINTQQAIDYGKKIKDNPGEIRLLEIVVDCLQNEINEVKKGNDIQLQADLAFQIQFCHEALKEATRGAK